jgi:AraC family transcriptional regulator
MADVRIEHRPTLRVGAIRHVGPYEDMKAAFDRLHQVVAASDLRAARILGLYYDDPQTTAPEALRADAAVVLPEGAPVPDGLIEREIPGGRYARVDHVGPYEGLAGAWRQLIHESLPQQGYRIGDGITHEEYLTLPGDPSAPEPRTALYAPVVAVAAARGGP